MEFSSVEASSRFLASTLHEIRTPIQTIISTAELLSETALSEEQSEYTRQIKFSAEVVVQLANDILDFSKIQDRNFSLESTAFNPCELVEQVVDSIAIEAYNKNIEIITDIDYSMPKVVEGDPVRIQQIVLNIIKNAVKFTEKGYIAVSVRERDGMLRFHVRDSGIGIAPDKRMLIFADYYQADASIARRYGGTGLGLAICKNLVMLMGGAIGVKENPGGGSIFWFNIPYKKPEIIAESLFSLESPPEIPQGTRLLLVDDSRLAAESLRRKLATFGIADIVPATVPASALDAMTAAQEAGAPFTMVFIDMQMPGMDGWQMAAEIRSRPAIAGTKLYLVVPEGQMRGNAKLMQHKYFDGYIYKPIKRNALEQLLRGCFGSGGPLPAAEALQPVPAEASAPQNGQRITVLVAEDHPMNRHLMTTFLKKLDAEVLCAENGQMAVDVIKEHPHTDIIFMDMQMPVKSGIDATVELRNLDYKGIIIACTANNDPKDFDRYTELGINDFLIKPYKRQSLEDIIAKWKDVVTNPEKMEKIAINQLDTSMRDLWMVNDFMEMNCYMVDSAKTSLQLFREQTATILAELKQELELENPDWELLQRHGHTLKGSSGLICSISLSAAGADMENAAKSQDRVAYEAARMDFIIDYTAFEKAADRWLTTV